MISPALVFFLQQRLGGYLEDRVEAKQLLVLLFPFLLSSKAILYQGYGHWCLTYVIQASMYQKIHFNYCYNRITHALNCLSNTYSDSDSCSGEAVGAAQTLVFDIPTDIEQSVSGLVEVEHLSIILLFFVLFS